MTAFLARFATIVARRVLLLCFCLAPALPQAVAQESDDYYQKLDEDLAALSSEDLEEILLFVAGNVMHTLYHEGGHMLVSELELPVLAQEEDAVDNLATITMLEVDTEDMDVFLTHAMIGWFLIAEDTYEDLTFYDEHDLNLQRGFRMLCLMVGADEATFVDFARDAGLPEDRIESCAFDYEQASISWEAATEPYFRDSDTPAGKIKVVHDPAPEGLQTLALFLKESELLEEVAREFDTFYDLPEEITFRATACGTDNAFWDPDEREVILCHEMLGGLAELALEVMETGEKE